MTRSSPSSAGATVPRCPTAPSNAGSARRPGSPRAPYGRSNAPREAATLLAAGVPIAQVIARLGYFDAPHLARALRRYVGVTARQLRDGIDGAIALNLDQRTTS